MWQPIETAPEEGYFLVSDGDEEGCYAVRREYGGFCYAWHEYDGPIFVNNVTHWMPLPPPPEA